jgi:multidrug efflux pump subunit AcrA (membrane-fusion protein)
MVAIGASTCVHSWIISALFLAASGTVSPGTQIAAITIPSSDVTLSCVQSGHIAEIHFKEGDKVSMTLL